MDQRIKRSQNQVCISLSFEKNGKAKKRKKKQQQEEVAHHRID
jgi:hypothetical protein